MDWDVGYERMRKVKTKTRVWASGTGTVGLPTTEMGEAAGRRGVTCWTH